jgi:hypothetical protein
MEPRRRQPRSCPDGSIVSASAPQELDASRHSRALAEQRSTAGPDGHGWHAIVAQPGQGARRHADTTRSAPAPPPLIVLHAICHRSPSLATARRSPPLPWQERAEVGVAKGRFPSRPPAKRPRRAARRRPAATVGHAGFARRLPPAAARLTEGSGGARLGFAGRPEIALGESDAGRFFPLHTEQKAHDVSIYLSIHP